MPLTGGTPSVLYTIPGSYRYMEGVAAHGRSLFWTEGDPSNGLVMRATK